MKDKRYLLRISGVASFAYILGNIVYNLLNERINDAFYSEMFLLIIALCFSLYFINISFKSINKVKGSVPLIIISSIYLLFFSFIPGILGFVFVRSLKEKKKTKLPIISEDKVGINSILFSILSILIFSFITFVMPRLKIHNFISSIILYAIIFVFIILLNIKNYIKDGRVFLKNFKKYLPFIIKRYFIMFATYLLVGVVVSLLNNGAQASNQESLNSMFKTMPIFVALLSCIYAPIIEESIFRLDIHNLIKNKYVFIILSGFLFGIAHVVNSYTSTSDLLYALVYGTMGINLAKAYYDSNNIFVSISMHFIQNTVAIIIMLFTIL